MKYEFRRNRLIAVVTGTCALAAFAVAAAAETSINAGDKVYH